MLEPYCAIVKRLLARLQSVLLLGGNVRAAILTALPLTFGVGIWVVFYPIFLKHLGLDPPSIGIVYSAALLMLATGGWEAN